MKTALLGCLAAMTIGIAGASAQSTAPKTPAPSPSASAAATATPTPPASAATEQKDAFITQQAPGTMRAPKLVGVAVYDSNNKSVGKIADLLLDQDGMVKAVVIGMGGFLGIGSRDIALPYSDIHWETAPRKVQVGQPGAGAAANPAGATAKPEVKTVPPAETEAYQGYPDKAVLDMTQAQLKSAPVFHYAQKPSAETSAQRTSDKMQNKD